MLKFLGNRPLLLLGLLAGSAAIAIGVSQATSKTASDSALTPVVASSAVTAPTPAAATAPTSPAVETEARRLIAEAMRDPLCRGDILCSLDRYRQEALLQREQAALKLQAADFAISEINGGAK